MSNQKRHQAGAPASQGGKFAPKSNPDFDGHLTPGSEPAQYRYIVNGETLVYDQPVAHDSSGRARPMVFDNFVEPVAREQAFKSPVSYLALSNKLPPNHQRFDRQRIAHELMALNDNGHGSAIDLFAGSIIDGHLSRGTAGVAGVTAAKAWRDEAHNRAHVSGDDRYADFARGVEDAAVLLMGSKLGIEGTSYGTTEEASQIAEEAFDLATTKRASAEDREQWRKYLKIAPSEAHWRGMMVCGAALSGTDNWWGFRDDIDRTIIGR